LAPFILQKNCVFLLNSYCVPRYSFSSAVRFSSYLQWARSSAHRTSYFYPKSFDSCHLLYKYTICI